MTNQLFVKMVLDTWNSKLKEADTLLDKLTDEELLKEVAPGRNRGMYLLGHLTAVNDKMIPLLNLGEQLFPKLNDAYLNNPDKAHSDPTSASELRQYWKKINHTLAHQMNTLKTDDWFLKHTSVSAEDFAKEPHRNRLNIIISRTNHLSYHLGQLAFLKN